MKTSLVRFYDLAEMKDKKCTYVVILAEYQDQWILVQHKNRDTWEIPGGHVEEGESTNEAAERELQEETGAIRYTLFALCGYSVTEYGELFYAKVKELGEIQSEIARRKLVKEIPADLTYPEIQPLLAKKVLSLLGRGEEACASDKLFPSKRQP